MLKTNRLIWATVLTLGALAYSAVAASLDMDALWAFDEGTGTAVTDSSGNGNHGTILGNLQWTEGMFGTALRFNGVSGERVDMGTYEGVTGQSDRTVVAWIKTGARCDFMSWGVNGTGVKWILRLDAGSGRLRTEPGSGYLTGTTPLIDDEWHHIASVLESGGAPTSLDITQYVDGQPDGVGASGSVAIDTGSRAVWIGEGHHGRPINGLMDEVAIFNRALSPEEILSAMSGLKRTEGRAARPSPANEANDVPRDGVQLSWTTGEFAHTHDVYVGKNFDDVNDADIANPLGVSVSEGLDVNSLPLDRLDFDTTYYWRIDEVNAPPTSHVVFKGNVWSFTVEPFAYPIENIAATASSEVRAGEGPENTVNGSGLDDDDLHSLDSADMWLSNFVDPDRAWIQYEFDRVHKLYQMWVWNYNSSVEPMVGFGIREATIEYSVDGTNWAVLGTTHEFARGPGVAGYAHNTTVDLGGVAAKYVKITANSNWGGILNQYGLSEVRFLCIPVFAREPSPDSGATNVDVDAILNFRAGREAAKHDAYLGTDEQAVIDGTVPVATVTEPSYACSLDLASTYYWRIDEVNDAEIPTTWQGDIWNLSTQEYLVVDDFESYNDIPAGEEGSNLVYGTWADGFENPANGSTIGYNVPFQPTIETSILYDGRQSVPLFYDNTVATYSEVTANVADLDVGQDWTEHGIKALTLRFYGDPNNAVQQMYVKINGSKVAYDGSAEDTRLTGWQMWYIDLASIGVSLSNVTELAIGFERIGAAGGKGMVLLDGIRLYSYDRQLITPVDPGAVGLQAH